MSQVQFQAPPLSKINKIILIITGLCFLANSILKAVGAFSLVNILGLSASGLFSGLIFQLLTYPFVETNLMVFIFNSLIVWFMGSELEKNWGERVYIRFLLLVVMCVGLIYTVVNLVFLFGTSFYFSPIHGLSGINFSLLIAYSMIYPDRQMAFMMIFPMKARTYCWILVGIEVYLAVFSSLSSSWAHLLAMGMSFLIVQFQSNPLVKKSLHFSWGSGRKAKKHLYVVKDKEDKGPKYWQ